MIVVRIFAVNFSHLISALTSWQGDSILSPPSSPCTLYIRLPHHEIFTHYEISTIV